MTETSLRELLGELFIIIGGFILAETIINQFLLLSAKANPWWILPLFSILLIMTALDFKNNKVKFIGAGGLGIFFLGSSLILITLVKNNLMTSVNFLLGILIISVITLIGNLILFFKRRR